MAFINISVLKKATFCCSLLVFISSRSFSETFIISSAGEFQNVQVDAKPNDSIVWKKGNYFNQNLILTADNVVFVAEDAGETIFTGSSSLKIEGDANVISGFQFIKGKIKGDVVDISGSNNTVKHINIQSYDSHYFLRVRPNCQYNKIMNCNFESKPETQESSVVQIEATEKLPGYHIISHCSFKNHTAPLGVGGDFGIEALRIGYSYQRTFISRTIVEYCYFEKCNGDYEVISNKACENVLRYNTFVDNGPAHLTLRHGSRAMVYGNFFMNGAGIRIKEGQNHSVVNNYFDTGDQFSIHIQNHHFDPVDTVKVVNNTFIGRGQLRLGGEGDYPPKNVLIVNSLFSGKFDSLISDATGNERWNQNVIKTHQATVEKDGFLVVSYDLQENEYGFSEPVFQHESLKKYKSNTPAVTDIIDLDDDFLIELDIMKQERSKMGNDMPGCYVPSMDMRLKWYATSKNTGPAYLD